MFFQNSWYQVGRSVVDLYVRFILQADIHHDGPLPKGAKIFAVNHPSTGDPAFVTVLTKEQTTILIKETLFKVPLFGRSLRLAGHVPVVAGNGRAALEEGIRLLRAGRTLIIFPEGEISPEGRFNKAHTGVARLALATGAPVIPVGISLNHKRIRQVYTTVEGKQEMGSWYFHGPYAMTVGEPVTFQGDPEDYEQVRQVTGQIMQQVAVLHRLGELRLAHRAMKRLNPQGSPRPMLDLSLHPDSHLTPDPRLGRAPRLSISTPKSAVQVAWKGTWLAFQQSTRMVMRSAIYKAVESGLLFLLMYARNF